MRNLPVLVFMLSILTGCSEIHYRKTDAGDLHGKMTVQWLEPDKFLFIPDSENPLTFTRHNGKKITPGVMYTDGGSIPRPLWAIRSYSPWGYGPAFIVHDWLFEIKHCKYPGYESLTHTEAAKVMSEVIKTLMEKYKDPEPFVLYSMHEAVASKKAMNLWENGTCDVPPNTTQSLVPRMEYVIEFP